MIDLPPPIAVHAPVPVVKTATATGMNQTNVSQRCVQNLGTLGDIMGFYSHSSPIFLGGKNNHRKQKTNMKHVSKMTKKRHKR